MLGLYVRGLTRFNFSTSLDALYAAAYELSI